LSLFYFRKKRRTFKDVNDWSVRQGIQQVLEPIVDAVVVSEDLFLEDSSDESISALDQQGLSPKKKRASSPPLSPVENKQFLATPEGKVGAFSYSHFRKLDSSKCKGH
jgi:hypothetical protein